MGAPFGRGWQTPLFALHCNAQAPVGNAGKDPLEDQLTVRLPESLSRALADAAERSRRSRSEIVRLALAEYLGGGEDGVHRAGRVRDLLGSLESGIPDLAERHRSYLLASLKDED